MEELINRIPCLSLLTAAGLVLFGGPTLNAQTSGPPEAAEEQGAMLPPEQHIEPAIVLEDEVETSENEASTDPDLQRSVDAQEQLAQDFALYKSLLASGLTADADVVAKRIVELSIRENGFETADTAKALTNLAIVQHRNQDYETAQQNYEAAIGIIERVEDRLNSDLINPLRGLGAAQLAAGRPDLALESFGRARHVSHVNEGPHNLDQIDIIEALAEIYIRIGEVETAYDLQDRIYQLYARRYEKDSADIVPALYKRAEWQHRLRQYGRERETYRRIIKIIEKHHGKNDLLLVEPLTGLGHSYLYVSDIDRDYQRGNAGLTTGEIFIKRAKRIAEEHPDSTWEQKENSYLSLADYYIYSDKPGKASRAYKEVWDLLSEDEDEARLANRYNHLETLVLLQDIYPPKYYSMNEDSEQPAEGEELKEGKIVTRFMVNERGRARSYEIIEAYPPGLEEMEKDVMREMRRLIYRPRLENGEVVETHDLTFTHDFFYRESDLVPKEEETENLKADGMKEEVADTID
jgi:tetratricopeptide (TPR) repeat protein